MLKCAFVEDQQCWNSARTEDHAVQQTPSKLSAHGLSQQLLRMPAFFTKAPLLPHEPEL
jgi:hypothetical protein